MDIFVTAASFSHIPVLRDAIVNWAQKIDPRCIVDCTLGGAGHAEALLTHFPKAHLIGIDRDPSAIAAAKIRLQPLASRIQIVHATFAQIDTVLADCAQPEVDLILADFGVSSHQLDTPERGFSFRATAPLDMRMDPSQGQNVQDLVASLDETALANAIFQLGEERHSRRIARAIVQDQPQTTTELAALIRRVVPNAHASRIDPATRTFQALRMLVNDELGQIESWLQKAPQCLRQGGLVMAISFHSLEDRAVKKAFRAAATHCICPPKLPVCRCGHQATLRILTSKAQQPMLEEIAANPRARSARLRVAQRL